MAQSKIPPINMRWSEADLSHKWFTAILNECGYSNSDDGYAFFRNEKRTPNNRGLARQDFTLFINKMPLVHVELKKPSEDLSRNNLNPIFFKQAHKYAFSHYVIRRDQLITPMGILTNGLHAYVFDGSISDPNESLQTSLKLDLSVKSDLTKLQRLISVSEARRAGGYFINEVITQPVKNLGREKISGADTFLAKELCSIYKGLLNCGLSQKNAFTATVTYFLTAILRDCGFIPTEELNNFEREQDWNGLVSTLEDHLQSDLSVLKIPALQHRRAFELYQQTRWLPVRLDIFPPDALGMAYEKLLHHVKGAKAKVCYYTPREVIDDILNEIEVDSDKTVLDPCSGSSGFLTSCVEKNFPLGSKVNPKDVKQYIENKLFGVDKDWFAVQMSKAALTAIYARYLPDESRFKAPVANVFEHNFFDFETLFQEKHMRKFDRIVGNPPWGNHLDWAEPEYHTMIKSMQSYKDKTCVSVYIYELATRYLKSNGRIGMLLKHEVFDGIKHENFRKFLTKLNATIWDYGRRKLFQGNGAQTIVAIGHQGELGALKVVAKDESAVKETFDYSGKTFSQLFITSKGFESGNNDIYEQLAQKFPRHLCTRPMIGASEIESFSHLTPKKYLFLEPGQPVDSNIIDYCKKTRVTLKLKKSKSRTESGEVTNTIEWFLNNRAELKRKNTKSIAWLWIFNSKEYFATKKKIFMPLYVKPAERIPAVGIYDKRSITKTDTCVLIPKVEMSEDQFRFALGFLNSKVGYRVLFNSVKQSGGETFPAFPEYVDPIILPDASSKVMEVVADLVEKCEAGDRGSIDLLDDIFEQLVTNKNKVNDSTIQKALRKRSQRSAS